MSPMERIVVVLWIPEPVALINKVRQRLPQTEVTYAQVGDVVAFSSKGTGIPQELLDTVTILVTFSALPKSAEEAPHLKHVHFLSAGIDHVANHPIISSSEIVVTTSSGVHSAPVGEWVTMTTLALSKHFQMTCKWQEEHNWSNDKGVFMTDSDWVGKRVGIAGYGSIGRQVARNFQALGAEVIALTASPRTTAEEKKDKGYIIPGTGDPEGSIPTKWMSGLGKESFHNFLKSQLDCLVLALPLTNETTNLLSTQEFEILKESNPRGCILINISRGKMIDQGALVKALNEGTLKGAALDVADPEPLPKDHVLWDAKNIIITPHTSPLGRELFPRAVDVLITNTERRKRGETMFNVVDRRKGQTIKGF